ncbi:unnamed protein product [Closterium sp. NIES-64]|nr:unnamed protein product [Closterium sp. NIES-64]
MINDFLEGHSAPVYNDDTSNGSHTPDDLNVDIASLSTAADGSSGAVARPTVKRISPKKDFFLVSGMACGERDGLWSNASQNIIDVRINGGGSVQATYRVVRLLMGAAKVPDTQLMPPMDCVIGTTYTENAMGVLAVDNTTAPHYYLGLYTDLNGTHIASAFNYAPFRQPRFTQAGRAGTYSAPFKFDHKGQLPVKEEQPVFGDRLFLVLSDGDCFSTCAVLTHLLGKRHKVPMVTVGGLPNQPLDKGSMPLKVQGGVRMAFTNAYVDSEIPCKFEFLPS